MTCWLCLGTGRVIDGVQVGKREYAPGPDHDKPCPRGCGDDAQIAKIAEKRRGQKRIAVNLEDL